MALKLQNPALKVMISLGGWVEAARRYSQMAASASHRREFIRSVSHFLERHSFDGLDLHWQYPAARELGGRPEDRTNFVLLAEALSEVFAPRGWLLSAAVSPSRYVARSSLQTRIELNIVYSEGLNHAVSHNINKGCKFWNGHNSLGLPLDQPRHLHTNMFNF